MSGSETVKGSPIDNDCATSDCKLDVAYAAYSCGVQVYRRSDSPPCPILAEAGPPRLACMGESVTLSAAASRACGCAGGARFRWWSDGALGRDWDADPAFSVTPSADTLYEVDVACADDLTGYDSLYFAERLYPVDEDARGGSAA